LIHNPDNFELIAKTLQGLENILAEELNCLGAKGINILRRAVKFSGNKEMMYKANIHLRTAIKILVPIYSFVARNEDMLYKEVGEVDWSRYMNVSDTLAVDGVVSSPYFKHSLYVALKTKDAIVDQFRKNKGRRPSVDPENPGLKINVHISSDQCSLSLDSSGEPLYKRGYRKNRNLAPLNESLAAGLILLSGWKGKSNFVDPMCGSGTLPIEAALIAYNIPPGIYRYEFGFEKWKDFDLELYRDIVDEVNEKTDFREKIIGSDVSGDSIKFALSNAKNALLSNKIIFRRQKMEEFMPPEGGGTAIINPPYGERIQKQDINKFYAMIGERIKHKFTGYDVWILSGNIEAMKNIGLHPSKKISLVNGDIECKFQKYSIYHGSMKSSSLQLIKS
jgi:putative N6-adenine-specific DNA methylase